VYSVSAGVDILRDLTRHIPEVVMGSHMKAEEKAKIGCRLGRAYRSRGVHGGMWPCSASFDFSKV
jgi:hypothetical protein